MLHVQHFEACLKEISKLTRFDQAAFEVSDDFNILLQDDQNNELGVYELCEDDEVPTPPELFARSIKRFDEQMQATT